MIKHTEKPGKSNGEDETVEIFQLVTPRAIESADPSSSLVEVEIAAATHRGLVRANNQDHYLALRFGRSLETVSTNIPEGSLEPIFQETGYGMVVADGMGGMAAGDVASRTALCKLVELVVNTPDWFMKVNQQEDLAISTRRMTQRFRDIDDELRESAQNNSALQGMGTTLTVAVSLGCNLLIGHIGDSRAYMLRSKRLHQLTRDDTLAQALIDAGIADPEDTATRAMRHVLTAAIGSTGEPVDPQVLRLRLNHDDQILLCTDGLTGMVSDEVIASTLLEAPSASAACQTLVDLALNAGGLDNVTIALAHYRFPA
ncbi:MAG: protein phosphatase 2C domain-containing protein [Pyrinomonadaceae bacterium]|nr:protein phosphatase 2C domain-containing protein [Pyrinomonadaceae bacterium]